ncbi:membrane protein [Cystobacter fuscus]|uniref:Membrane protein n=1 Tax=Cystobacter fuscus TaxID=43 RepID=A0A250JB09_9BACT|nr:LysM domain-containing protein [Cystobacter fuscus]ATB40763.1 membrane protein [Cystobacter fuscus]
MPNPHTVNDKDGLSSLWLIAKHYRVSLDDLKQRNSLIMNRFPVGHPRHGWLKLGDKVLIPAAHGGGRAMGPQMSSSNTLIDDNPWRAFLFVLADEVLPSGKLVRKVLEFPGPSQAQYIQANPEIFGMKPPNSKATFSLGEHALGQNQSRFLSASTRRGGAPNIAGRPVYIDIKKATAAGVKIHSTEAILADLARIQKSTPSLQPRIEKLKTVIASVEGEVLLEGNIPASAIKSKNAMMMTRSLRGVQVVGMAFTVYDIGKATSKSVKQGSVKPIAAEGIRQVGGWAAAVAGAKAGGLLGAAAGVETGPGAILTGFAGALIVGTAGYFGADWVADFIDEN